MGPPPPPLHVQELDCSWNGCLEHVVLAEALGGLRSLRSLNLAYCSRLGAAGLATVAASTADTLTSLNLL